MISRLVTIISICIVLISTTGKALPVDSNDFLLRVIKQPEETVILEIPVRKGDHFYIDYIHSSDHTPIHDIFKIGEAGAIILIEEDYAWYGAGLEFHPDADAQISLTGDRVRVLLNRMFPYLPLRVGRVAGHTLTCKDKRIPLLTIAEGGDRVWIVTVKRGETDD